MSSKMWLSMPRKGAVPSRREGNRKTKLWVRDLWPTLFHTWGSRRNLLIVLTGVSMSGRIEKSRPRTTWGHP
jgi:hypothetical protein